MSRKILLVDDDKAIHTHIKIIAEKSGYQFCSAYAGAEGLKKLVEEQPDLLILDFMMPNKNGIEVYDEIKTNPDFRAFKSIPVIMLTAFNQSHEEVKRLLNLGLCAYLEKPFGPRELLNVIDNAFLVNEIRIKNEKLKRAIEESKNFLENLVASCPLAIITADNDGEITFVSRGIEEMVGEHSDHFLGQSLMSFLRINEEQYKAIKNQLTVSESLVKKEFLLSFERVKATPIRVTFSHLRDHQNDVTGMLVVGEDLSHQKQLEKERLEKERLQAITESLATINHKINNPLTPILGNLHLIRMEEKTLPSALQKKIDIIEANAKRIFRIIQEFNRVSNPIRQKYYGKTSVLNI